MQDQQPEDPDLDEPNREAPPTPAPTTPVVEAISPPLILMTPEVVRDTHYIIQAMDDGNEVGWLGSVRKKDNEYTVHEIYLIAQTVTMTSCEFKTKALGEFYSSMKPADAASILFWGHLHPHGYVDASFQDEEQMEEFADNPYFIRGIFLRDGRVNITFFDYAKGVRINDCGWNIALPHSEARRSTLLTEIKAKVKEDKSARIHSTAWTEKDPADPRVPWYRKVIE